MRWCTGQISCMCGSVSFTIVRNGPQRFTMNHNALQRLIVVQRSNVISHWTILSTLVRCCVTEAKRDLTLKKVEDKLLCACLCLLVLGCASSVLL